MPPYRAAIVGRTETCLLYIFIEEMMPSRKKILGGFIEKNMISILVNVYLKS